MPTARPARIALFLVLLLALPAGMVPVPARAGPEPEAAGAEAAGAEAAGAKAAVAPKTFVVTRRPFAVTMDLQGTFVPSELVEVAYVPRVYGGALEVREAFPGGPVVQGQTLVSFEEEWIQRDLENAERDLFIARARLQRQEAELKQKKEATEIQRLALARGLERAERKLKHFRETDKADRVAKAEHNLKGTENRIQDETEELEQLEKMYRADDLTEETEAIVMRRARRGLSRMRQSFEWARKNHQRFLDEGLPQEEQDIELDVRRRQNDNRAYLVMSEADLRRADLELEKARASFALQETRLRELREDRDQLRVRASGDGYAVPGAFKTTSWSDVDGMKRALSPGGRFKARQVLFTIVRPGDVAVRTAVGEADLAKLEVGQAVEVRAGTAPQDVLQGVVQAVSPLGSGGKHTVDVSLQEAGEGLMPATSAKIRVILQQEDEVLVVPNGAIRKDGDRRLLYVLEGGNPVERVVKLGASSGGKTVIVEGLKAGEKVLEQAPAEAK